jgi:hypothetical protein
MSQAANSISTSVKIRFPREMLAAVDDWAAHNNVPRSKAVRALIYRSMMGDWSDFDGCTCDGADQCHGGCGYLRNGR